MISELTSTAYLYAAIQVEPMITDEKINAVKKQLKNGVPAGEIKTALTREGYSTEDIEKCFQVHRYDMRSWYLIFAIVFLIIGFIIFLQTGALLFLLFSAAMFFSYFLAKKKWEGNK